MVGLSLALVGCGAIPRVPLSLPPRDAPVESRAAAYRARMASTHRGLWRSWEVQFGDDAGEVPLRDARSTLENAPRAEEIFHDRDNHFTIGGALVGVGTALVLGGAVATPFSVRDDGITPAIPVALMLGGLVASTIGAFMLGSAEYQVTYGVDAYNRWLWDALALPRAGSATGPVTPLQSPAPWGATLR